MRHLKCKDNKGFTITEIMVSVSIFLILVMLIMGSMLQGIGLWEIGVYRSNLQTNAQRSINEMIAELRNATRIAGAIPPDANILGAPPNNDTIVFYLPTDIDGDGTIIDAATGDTEWDLVRSVQYGYDPINQQLVRLYDGNIRILANYVTQIQFDDWNTDVSLNMAEIKITLQLQRFTSQQRQISVALVSYVKLRN